MKLAPHKSLGHHSQTRVLALAVASTVFVALFVLLPSVARAQQGAVSISNIACSASPEAITILNAGSDAVDLNGWHLESDPGESFDLSVIQTLATGASVTIEAGPAASGSLLWSANEVLRDDDDTDYARIVDDTGATIDEEACTAAAEPSPTPGDVPNGGGPPAPASGPATVLVLAGAGLSAAALALLTFVFLPLSSTFARLVGRSATGGSRDVAVEAVSSVPVPGSRAVAMTLAVATTLALALLIALALNGRGSR